MKTRQWFGAVVAGTVGMGMHSANAQPFADTVVAYAPGVGFAVEFGSNLGYTNAAAALGSPARVTPGDFGGPVDPFSPPFLRDQLVSVGAGGFLTVAFAEPVANRVGHLFGLDFTIFGSAGFTITNGNFTGGGVTDGSLFGQNAGASRVAVSADNRTYFTLDTSQAPGVDGYFPTDGGGDFARPVDPTLAGADFAGRGLGGIRALYAGSGGGTGYDIGWARDSQGNPVELPSIRFVRIDVLEGHAEIDGLAAVPEPSIWALGSVAAAGWWVRRRMRRRERPVPNGRPVA